MKSLPNCSTCKVIGLPCLEHSSCRLREQAPPPKWRKLRDPSQAVYVAPCTVLQEPSPASLEKLSARQGWGNRSPETEQERCVLSSALCYAFPTSPHFAQSRHICFHMRSIRKEKRSQVKACFCSSTKQCCSLCPLHRHLTHWWPPLLPLPVLPCLWS